MTLVLINYIIYNFDTHIVLGSDRSDFVNTTLIISKSSPKLDIFKMLVLFLLTTYLVCVLALFFNSQEVFTYVPTVALSSTSSYLIVWHACSLKKTNWNKLAGLSVLWYCKLLLKRVWMYPSRLELWMCKHLICKLKWNHLVLKICLHYSKISTKEPFFPDTLLIPTIC